MALTTPTYDAAVVAQNLHYPRKFPDDSDAKKAYEF